MRLSLLPLNELYEKKITATVEAVIHTKEDFSTISETYCEKVCKLPCKAYKEVQLLSEELDILIVQDHNALKGKYDRTDTQSEDVMRGIIQHICQEAGFEGLRYSITNLLKCPVSEANIKKGKAPTATVLLKCKPYLVSEIERCKPKVIISLSTATTKSLGLKKHSNTGNRGEIVDNRIVITLHPKVLTMIRQTASGALWGQEMYKVIVRDFKKAADLVRGKLIVPNIQESIAKLVKERMTFAESEQDVRDIMTMLNVLPENSVVSFDTETTSLDGMSPEAKLLTIQFGWRDPIDGLVKAAVIPLWHRENSAYNPDNIWDEIAAFLVNSRPKVAHNGKFDILYIYWTKGVRVQNCTFDTMLMLHSLDSGAQGTFGLKAAVWDFIPEMGFGGYEALLPPLTKPPKAKKSGEEVETDDDEDVENGN